MPTVATSHSNVCRGRGESEALEVGFGSGVRNMRRWMVLLRLITSWKVLLTRWRMKRSVAGFRMGMRVLGFGREKVAMCSRMFSRSSGRANTLSEAEAEEMRLACSA
jgi:hypothetical protein